MQLEGLVEGLVLPRQLQDALAGGTAAAPVPTQTNDGPSIAGLDTETLTELLELVRSEVRGAVSGGQSAEEGAMANVNAPTTSSTPGGSICAVVCYREA